MKVIENKSAGNEKGKPGAPKSIIAQVQAISHKGSARETFFSQLEKFLDNRYVLVDNALPSGFSELLPPVLVGPTGIWLINMPSISGVFKASGEDWEQLDKKSGSYRPAKPNLVAWTVEKAHLLDEILSQGQRPVPTIEPVVYFSAPDAHVELARPAAKIVLVDGVQRFINAVLSAPIVLDHDAIQAISETLAPALVETEPPAEIADSYSLQEEPPHKPPRTPTRLEEIARSEPQVVTKISRKLPLTRKQWIWLGILIAVNIVILILLVFIVVINT
jgi:hypothetical protein